MARAALLGRLTWRVATVTALRDETPTARTLVLQVPGWPGHDAGQHVDVRLTAPDGYRAVRSYSIASVPAGDRVELTVDQVVDGEVSPDLARVLAVGDRVELRGPVGGWFVWRPDQSEPVQLVAGGSGVVPVMCMLRSHAEAGSGAPVQFLYSARTPGSVIYRDELDRLAGSVPITYAYTRVAPPGWPRPPGRVGADVVDAATFAPALTPACYVCGPTGFVETVADLLVQAGHDPARIRTERFGPSASDRVEGPR